MLLYVLLCIPFFDRAGRHGDIAAQLLMMSLEELVANRQLYGLTRIVGVLKSSKLV